MADVDAKLRALIDRDEIWQVLLRYARGLDRLDVAMARSCYFDDAIDDHGRFVGGPDGFIAWANAESAAMYVSQHHNLTNHHVELAGDDAYAETYFMFTGVARQPPHLLSTGRYIDHFQRRAGEWRIANRVMIVERNFALPEWPVDPAIAAAHARAPAHPVTRDANDVSYHRPPRPRARNDG